MNNPDRRFTESLATQGADIVVDLAQTDIKKIISLLSSDFYIEEEMAKDAVKRRSSFNIIDKDELFKIDIFIPALDEISSIEMERRMSLRVDDADEQPIYVCTPEDIIAHKRYWYKLVEGVSERQWNNAIMLSKFNGTVSIMSTCDEPLELEEF